MRKKSMTKRIMAMILSVIMVLSLAGCSGGGNKNNSDNASTTNQGKSDTGSKDNGSKDSAVDTSKHEVINFLVLGNKPTNGRLEAMLKELNKILTEKVNAELQLTYVEWADWQTQYNVQLLSGDTSLDIITTATDWLYAWENTQKGAFLPLSDDMLKTYAPKTYEQVSADGDWDICKYNGEVYFIPEDHYTQYTNHGMFYRGDWAKEAGLTDGTVSKFEDLTTYFKYIKDNKDGVIPWDAGKNSGDLLGFYIQSHTNYRNLIGVNAGNYAIWSTKPDDATVSAPFMEDDTIYAAADLMKQWNDMGVWREDVLNYDGDSREEFYAGTSGADQHHSQTFYSQVKPNMDTKQAGSDSKMYAFGSENSNIAKDLKTHGAAAISANSKHPERALMVYDLLRNDEQCYRLINYGIEGTDYVITDDGKLGYPEGYDQSTDALGSDYWCGRNDDLELVNSFTWSGRPDMIEGLNKIAYDYEYENLIINKDKIDTEQAAIASVLSEYWPQLAWGKFDNPKEKIDEMRAKVKAAGYDDVKASIQADLDAFKKSQSK
ncbi:extracellular solute-binding protein [Anaerocolumna jejuensis DSM 15929]|uniref:Extracellular solute-binding protein n=1 Tax=Anaerocolumna jejuensis DSM 15929 TaxID=1121322 RepID=A0A1M6NMY3_9FIRM|nr:ABC transporter substrate-binding protein [Anaerocolumna jejuensis]SHJ97018.1 extracellular solute-binding protein [Anaerocolumna jejuensis DSM 15929]